MSSDGRYRGANDKEGKPNPFVEIVTTGRHSQPGTGRHGPLGQGQGTGRHSQPGTGRHAGAKPVREEPREGPRRSDPRSDDFDERSAPLTEPAPPPAEFEEIENQARVSLEPEPVGPITDPSPAPVPSAAAAQASMPAAASVAQPTGAVNVALVSARAPAAETTQDLPPELLARLRDAAELHAALRSMNHYQLLGVSSQASLREVRAAYFGLSKRFHPDAFFRKEIGSYRAKLESVFDALTGAYEALRKTGARSEYDDSIALPQALRAVPEVTRSSRPPGARIETEFDRVQREVGRRAPSTAPPATNAMPPGPPLGSPVRAPGAGREMPTPANTNAPAALTSSTPRPSKPTPKPRSSHPPVRGSASDRARSASDRARPAATSDRARSAHNPPAPRQMQEMGPSTRSLNVPASGRDPSARPDSAEPRSGTGPRPSLQGTRGSVRPSAPGAKGASSPGAQTGSTPNPFDESERRSTQLRELDRLMQQRLDQSAATPPARPSLASPGFAAPTTGKLSAPITGNFPAPGTGNFPAPGTGNFPAPGTGNFGAPATGTFGTPTTGTTGTGTGPTSLVPEGAGGSKPPHLGPSLLELAEQLSGGTGLANWASQRLREAYHEEQAGHVVDAANIVRIVLNQYKDAQVEAHSQRLSRLVAAKTAPAQKMRARAAEKDGLWKEAAECWAKVREGCPSDGQAAYHHARTLMQAGDLKSAGRAAMRAAELAPEHVETREVLIEFFEKMGMKLNARRERDTVQKLLEAKAKAPPPPPPTKK